MTSERAVFAGGCFWGMEEIIRNIAGVLKTQVGYTGGVLNNPTYTEVKKGNTGHAEAIEVTFDSGILTYRELLIWFFKMHDPTTRNRQGNDVGSQYRSAIFYTSADQKETALKIIQETEASKKWPKPIVTEVIAATEFYSAEEYHQQYLKKNPGGYTCHFIRN